MSFHYIKKMAYHLSTEHVEELIQHCKDILKYRETHDPNTFLEGVDDEDIDLTSTIESEVQP